MPASDLRDLDPRLAFAFLLFGGLLLLWRWCKRENRVQFRRSAAVALAILPLLSFAYLAFEILRSTRVAVAPNEHVIVTRFGAPVLGPISEPSTFRIVPFGIDQVQRFPKKLEAQRLACEGLAEPRTATILIDDPMVFWKRGATVQRLPHLVCLALNRQARTSNVSINDITALQLNLAVRDLGLEIGRLD